MRAQLVYLRDQRPVRRSIWMAESVLELTYFGAILVS